MEGFAWPVVASLAFVGILLIWEPVGEYYKSRKIAAEFRKRSAARKGASARWH